MGRFRVLLAVTAAFSLAVGIPVAGANAKGNAPTLHLSVSPHLQKLTSAQVAKLGLQPSNQKVIIILKNQYMKLSGGAHHALSTRGLAITSAERPVLSQLYSVHATRITPYSLVNAISATVSRGELTYLRSQSAIKAIVPDKRLYLPKPLTLAPDARENAASKTATQRHSVRKATGAGCNANKPLLEPEALTQINDQFQNPKAKGQAISLATGKGVTVAFMADGVSYNDGDFIRPNGSSVFSDIEDFGGSGGIYLGGADEGMLDASSIAAQGNERYFVGDYTSYFDNAFNNSSACPVIKVVGAAPGASLMDLQISGTYTTTSGIVQAIQYAVDNHANVFNQSWGGDVYPDLNADPLALADKAAVADGLTIVVSSGDGGTNGTQISASTLPGVIAAAASTSFQIYKQLGEEAFPLSNGNYVDDGVSALSSAGPNQTGTKGPDIMAPGDLNWALCDPGAGCVDNNGNPAGVFETGGTSESAPLTAGVAALVIQRYRATHHGASPSPEVVKEIIASTATDLHLPSNIQGAGLLNAYKAVQLAGSWGNHAHSSSQGNNIFLNVNNCLATTACNTTLSATGTPGTAESWSVGAVNEGTAAQKVTPTIQTLHVASTASGSVTLNPATDPYFVDPFGAARSYREVTTSVPAGTGTVNFAVAWDDLAAGQGGKLVRVAALNPDGAYACYSLPQGSGNGYGSCLVHDPKPGTWTIVVFTRGRSSAGYAGSVNWSATKSNWVSDGSVSPASKKIMPGQSATFTVHATLPAAPGDGIASVVVKGKAGGRTATDTAIPVILRSVIPTTAAGGGSFSGVLIGGNGRAYQANEQTFQFNVPAGQNDLSVGLSLTSGTTDNVEAMLLAPSGVVADTQTNIESYNGSGEPDGLGDTLQLVQRAPVSGLWTLTVLIDYYSGSSTTDPFTGSIAFNTVNVTSSGIPDSAATTVSPGSPATGTITVHNTGNSFEFYFLDPRVNTLAGYDLMPPGDDNSPGGATAFDEFDVPTETSSLDFMASGSDASAVNLEAEFIGSAGPAAESSEPDIEQLGTTNATSLLYSSGVTNGYWILAADDLQCPCDSTPADSSDVITLQTVGMMQDFNTDIATDTGDFFIQNVNLVGVPPGDSATINVSITPTASAGTEFTGNIYVDTLGVAAPGYLNNGGVTEEVAAVPYDYTAGS